MEMFWTFTIAKARFLHAGAMGNEYRARPWKAKGFLPLPQGWPGG
jgi:hypothetical protein